MIKEREAAIRLDQAVEDLYPDYEPLRQTLAILAAALRGDSFFLPSTPYHLSKFVRQYRGPK